MYSPRITSMLCIILMLCTTFLAAQSQQTTIYQVGHVYTLDKPIKESQFYDRSDFWSSYTFPNSVQKAVIYSLAGRGDIADYSLQVYFRSRSEIITLFTFTSLANAEEFQGTPTNDYINALAQGNALRQNNDYTFIDLKTYRSAIQNVPATCVNRKLDETETDVDCGGDCSPCMVNQKCNSAKDCGNLTECLIDQNSYEDDDENQDNTPQPQQQQRLTAAAGICVVENSGYAISMVMAIVLSILAMAINIYSY